MLRHSSIQGLVVNLPEGPRIGVIIDATKQRDNLYKATVVCSDATIMIAQFRLNASETGEQVQYIDYTFYDFDKILRCIG